MGADQAVDGKRFLKSLIQRGIAVLTTMDQMLNHSEVPLKQQMDMINSVYLLVGSWENVLPTVGPPVPEQNLINFTEDPSDSSAPELEPKQNPFANFTGREVTEAAATLAPEFDLPLVPLVDRYKPGQTGACDISCICDSESEFYIIDSSAANINFVEVLQTLQNVNTELEVLPASTDNVFGVVVDGTIFRAVRSRQNDPPFIKLLDTGEVLAFDASSMILYELPPFYAKLPPFAIKCFLIDVEDCNAASFDCRKYLKANLYRRLGYKILEVNESSLKVSLNSEICVVKTSNKEEVKQEEPNYKISLDTLTQAQLNELYEEPLNTTNVMKAVMGYAPKDDKRICPFYDPAIQGCFKGSRCQLEHVAKLSDGWTRDRSLHKMQIRAELETPAVGTEMMVIPTCIVNVDEFYAHIPRQDLSKALIELQDRLNDEKTIENFRLLNHEPHFRDLVFAKYLEDDQWYRARVVEFYNPDQITVFYVDYGNTADVTIRELRCWDDQFDYLPFQALHCRIANVQRIRENHTEAIWQLYKDIINKGMKIKILDNLSPWEVLLFDDEDNDIGQFLTLTKLALPREPLVTEKHKSNYIPG